MPTFEENGAAASKKNHNYKRQNADSREDLKILADVTEQPIQRPKDTKKRKKSYSRKKKMTTIKTEIVIEESGQILSISKSHRGRMHDFRIRKQEKLLPKDSIKYADSGYQGWQKLQKNVVIPYKKYRKKPLTEGQPEL